MKRLLVLAGLVAAFACSSLEAQTTMTAKIPFAFQVGSTSMPAGEYRVDYSDHVLTVRSVTGNHAVRALMLPNSRSDAPKTGVLEFRCYGNARFFSGIWGPYSTLGGALPKSAREKELISSTGSHEATAIALNSR